MNKWIIPYPCRARSYPFLVKKLPGNTLIEVLTSLALIGVVFSLGLMLVARLSGPLSPPERAISQQLGYDWLNEELPNPVPTEIEKLELGRQLIKRVAPYSSQPDLSQVSVQVFHRERLLWEHHRLIPSTP